MNEKPTSGVIEAPQVKKIRVITVRDRIAVTDLFVKAIVELKDESIEKMISSSVKNSKQNPNKKNQEKKSKDDESFEMAKIIADVSIDLLLKCKALYNTEVIAWYASLVGVTPDEFLDLPINQESSIIVQIRTSPEGADFFMQCWQAAKLTYGLKTPLKNLKEWFDTLLQKAEKQPKSS